MLHMLCIIPSSLPSGFTTALFTHYLKTEIYLVNNDISGNQFCILRWKFFYTISELLSMIFAFDLFSKEEILHHEEQYEAFYVSLCVLAADYLASNAHQCKLFSWSIWEALCFIMPRLYWKTTHIAIWIYKNLKIPIGIVIYL